MAKRFCAAPGCDKALHRNNTGGLCQYHTIAARREVNPIRLCAQCKGDINRQNKSGICGACKSVNGIRRKGKCSDCGRLLRAGNATGKCVLHIHPNSGKAAKEKPLPPYTVEQLTEAAAWMTHTPVEALHSQSKLRWIVRIRFAIWHLAEPHFSYGHIGRVSGCRDHSTIVHGCTVAADLIERDKLFTSLVAGIKRETIARLSIERLAA